MSQLKLTADSGGGTVAIKGPASTAGNAAIELTVPGTGSSTLATTATAGKIIQVVSTTKTDTFSESVSSGGVSGTAISLNFTATSTNNKLLIMANLMLGHSHSTERVGAILYAGGSVLTGAVGDANSSNTRISTGGFNDQDNSYDCVAHSHLFTPASTNQITYEYRLHNGRGATGTVYLNRQSLSDTGNYIGRGTSTITIMEVSA